jgi:2'-hydroxyisoflavone reductase
MVIKVWTGLTFDTVLDAWSFDPMAVRTAGSHFPLHIYILHQRLRQEPCAVPALRRVTSHRPQKSHFKYAADKRGGEPAAKAADVPALISRLGLILGPYEGIDGRLPWWLGRMRRGGRTLTLGPSDNGLQYIDARDLVSFVLDAGEKRIGGVYNVGSKPAHMTMGRLLVNS